MKKFNQFFAEKAVLGLIEFFDVDGDKIKGNNRTKVVVLYRSFFIKFVYDELKVTYKKIGAFLNKNHATLINNVLKLNEVLEQHPEINKQYEQYKTDLL